MHIVNGSKGTERSEQGMLVRLRSPLLILALLSLLGMGKRDGRDWAVDEPTALRHTYDEFVEMVGTFPYSAPEAKRQQIITNYPRLALGMTKEQVLAGLGEPDVELLLSPKIRAKTKGGGFHGWAWRYYLYKLERGGQNSKYDQEVEIFFDPTGRVTWIVPSNIEGLIEKNRHTLPQRTHSQFIDRVGAFPYVAPETKRAQLIMTCSKLALGMTMQRVRGLLGEPDVEALLYTTGTKTEPPGLFHGWRWTYYLYKLEPGGESFTYDQDAHTQAVHILFDPMGHVERIVPTNIEGLVEKSRVPP